MLNTRNNKHNTRNNLNSQHYTTSVRKHQDMTSVQPPTLHTHHMLSNNKGMACMRSNRVRSYTLNNRGGFKLKARIPAM